MHPESLYTFVASFPTIAMSLVGFAVIVSSLKQRIWKEKDPQKRRRGIRFSTRHVDMGFAFLPLGIVYRPSLVEVVKAQIRQQEDVDEDDNGDPDSPAKHLLRQLRRIRRGERVDFLVLRLK
jgi:hypothetical protein